MTEPILMGNVCVKAGGHAQWRGERDYGTCGGHFGADIMLVPHEQQTRDIDWEAVALSQGERENYFEDLSWKAEGLREQIAAVLAIHTEGLSADGSAWGGEQPYPICEADLEEWPCKTVAACTDVAP